MIMQVLSKHQCSIEALYHFRCCGCNKWWSIADWTPFFVVYCPHCGLGGEPTLSALPADVLAPMTDQQRLDYFGGLQDKYCDGCGRTQPECGRCQCQNDE